MCERVSLVVDVGVNRHAEVVVMRRVVVGDTSHRDAESPAHCKRHVTSDEVPARHVTSDEVPASYASNPNYTQSTNYVRHTIEILDNDYNS